MTNITMDQGSSFSYTFTLTDTDDAPFELDSFDARLQVRRTVADSSVLINCTLMNGKLALGTGTIILTLAPNDTSSIRFNNKEDDTLDALYDLEIVSPAGKVYKPAKGTFTILREITR